MSRSPVRNVLLVNTAKADALTPLWGRENLAVTVVTEPWYRHLYPADTDIRVVSDITDFQAVRDVALDVARSRGLDRILSPSERSMQTAAYLRSLFGISGIGYETANLFTNKIAMKRALARAGIPVAAHRQAWGLREVAAIGDELGWPIVVKPALGTGSVHTTVIASPAALRTLADSEQSEGLRSALVPLIVESLIGMEAELHCDGIVHDGTVRFASPSRYLVPLLGRTADFTGSWTLRPGDPDAAELLALHQRVVAVLGLQAGVTHLEVFRTAHGMLVGEIAARPGGGGIVDSVRLQHGVDLWEAFLDTSLGVDPDPRPKPRAGITMNCDLPIRPGRITALSTPEELGAVPGVAAVRMLKSVGSVVRRRIDSAAATGILQLRLDGPEEITSRLAMISDHYVYSSETE